jgi:hypothetical protein
MISTRELAVLAAGVAVIGGVMLTAINGALWFLTGGAVTLLGPTVVGVLVVGAAGWALLAARSRARYIGGPRMIVHTRGNSDREVAAWHEAGHVAMTRAVGGKVKAVAIHNDGSGYTSLRLPRGIEPAARVAVDVSGEVGSGTSAGCSSDHSYMRSLLRTLPAGERAGVKAAGYALARATCTRAALGSTAQRLIERGRI